MMRRGVFIGIILLLPAGDLMAQSYQRVTLSPNRRPTITVTNQGAGHAIRRPTLRPFAYLTSPDINKPRERAFTATTPRANSWVRAGMDVNTTYGDYYVDPTVWTNNFGRLPTDPAWRDPADPVNWISTRAIRFFIRRPYTPPR